MKYSIAENNEDLRRLVAQMADAQVIAFDTEFVSEFTYRPDLCLLQVAADGHLWVVDPHAIASIDEFWNALCQGNHVTIVHAGREEFRFCRRAVGRVPANWFDVQLAAGLIGLEYPTSYGKLLTRLLNRKLPKGETRTDWRRRPLSQAQLEYALQDVVHLEPLYQQLSARLQKLGRRSWLDDENARWQQDVIDSDERERWRRVSGTSGLGPRALLAVKYLWQWREEQAEQRDCIPKRVLRDDLIVELARRGRAEVHQIRAIRGMERGDLKKQMAAISDCLVRAEKASADELPKTDRTSIPAQVPVMAQFLNTALASIARQQDLAPGIVGTVQDLRDLIAYHLGLWPNGEELPLLARGWRAGVVGKQIEDLLDGRLGIRIRDPLADEPLSFVKLDP